MHRILFVTFALAGCAVVPTTKTTVRTLRTETAIVERPDSKITVDATATAGKLDLRATRHGICDRQQIAVEQHHSKKHAKYRAPKDPRAGALAFVLAPVTLPVSAIYTGLAVAASGSSKIEKRVVASEPFTCTAAGAELSVVLTLPSGRVVERTTDSRGELTYAIPATEPYRGTVIAAAGSGRTSVEYTRPMPAVTALREAARSCATRQGVTGTIGIVVDVDAEGTGVAAADAGVGACVTSALANVKFAEQHRASRLQLRVTL